MKTIRSSKKALLMSLLSLVMCCAMLVGSTFAWFTDSVTSGSNKIVAGNLDVELQYSTDCATWTDVDETTNIFKEDALWEPGYTEVVYLKVKNAGTLALKYQLDVIVASKVIGKTAEGADIDLSEFIKYGVAIDVEEPYASRADALDAIKTTEIGLSEGYIGNDCVLEKETESGVIALVVYMPETIGNAANHGTGETAPQINLALSVLATQAEVERDSFDETYDKEAVYPVLVVNNAEGVANALGKIQDGGVVELSGDVEMPSTGEPLTVAGKDVTIDLNGHTLSSPSVKETLVVDSGANVTVTGGDIVFTESHYNPDSTEHWGVPEGAPYIVVYNDEDGIEDTTSLNLENCTIEFQNLHGYGDDPLNGISVAAEEGKQAELNIGEGTLIDCKIGSGAAVILGDNATVNMTGGKIIANNCEDQQNVSVYAVYLDRKTSTFNMIDGEIEVTGISAVTGIILYRDSVCNMKGGKITIDAYSNSTNVNGQYVIGVESYGNGTFNMTGGEMNVKASPAGNVLKIEAFDVGNGNIITIGSDAHVTVDQTGEGSRPELGIELTRDGVTAASITIITE